MKLVNTHKKQYMDMNGVRIVITSPDGTQTVIGELGPIGPTLSERIKNGEIHEISMGCRVDCSLCRRKEAAVNDILDEAERRAFEALDGRDKE